MKETVDMNEDTKLTPEEKKLLKQKIHAVFNEFPIELQQRILDTKKEKLKTLYMIQGWARDNGHDEIVELIGIKIAHKEAQIDDMEKRING
ncbi:MAG: hypothetical protein ACI4QM_00750 [Alphaproteobacteria bacterium]